MTIADNLTALAEQKLGYHDSVEACKISLENKDVVVPVDAKLADISGLIDEITADKSWANYVAVRNRTKTSIDEGDIDLRTITGTSSAAYLFYGSALTSVYLNFAAMTGTSGCMTGLFQLCSNLTTVRLSLPLFSSAVSVQNIFTSSNNINTLIFYSISDNAVWSVVSANNNILTQTQLANCQNLSFNSAIKPNLYLAVMTSLNLASVVQVLGQLFDYSAGVAHTITFNRSFTGLSLSDYNLINNAKIQANARNWTVAGLTYSM